MESLPKIGQTIAKTMRVPINQLKKLSSEGKITTEVIIKALKKIEKQGFPEPDGAAAFTKAMKDLSTAIGQRLTPVLNPVLKLIAGLVNKFLELPKPVQAAVIGFTAVAGAFAVIAPLLPAIAAGIAGIIAVVTGPVGIVAGIAGAVAGFFAMKGAAEESKEPMVQVNDEAAKTKAAVEAAARAKQEFIEKTKEHISALEAENAQITAAEQAYENTIKVTDARLNAESEINKLQGQILERAYEQAGSARERLNIAAKIYQNEVAGARIAYQQTLNSIEAEKQRLLFRLQTAQVEARIIQAKGELAAAEADSAEKAQLILDKTQLAVQAQQESVRVIAGQITAQNRIAEQQKIAAAAVLRQKELTAQSKLESKLVGDKIVRSKEEARRLSENLAGGNTNSRNLATATGQVAINARNSAHMFIRVADNADSAARAISRAAAAQRELNAARAAAAAARAAAAAQQGGQAVQQAAGGYNRGSFKAFARGGVVKGPTLGLIGEGGEPEYIIPQSKAAGFSANYLAGKRGISAVPGFAAGGVAMPSSANVSIQTGPVTQMNGQNFVTISEMSAAVRAGVEQTLDLIQRDGMIRAGLSI